MAGYQSQGFPDTLVSCIRAVMHFLKDQGSQPKCIWDDDLAVMEEETLVW